MSYIYDLYFGANLLEDKVEKIKNSQEILDLENKLKDNPADFEVYHDLKFLLIFNLCNLMEEERELALKRGIKIGMELQEYFASLLEC